MTILENIKKLFENNPRKSNPKINTKKVSAEFVCLDNEFGAKQLMELISFINGLHTKYRNINMPIYICFKEVEIIDKLSYIILECICYSLMKDYRHEVAISWLPNNNILTQGVFLSPLALINNNVAKSCPKYLEKFQSEIYRYHFRKVISEDKTDTNYLGSLQQDVFNFLSTFYIEENYKDDIVEMIGEIVGNAIEHANSQCLLDIDVTTDHSKCVESEVQDGDFYGINIVILNFSDVLFGDKIKKRIENEELDTDDRYIVLKKAYKSQIYELKKNQIDADSIYRFLGAFNEVYSECTDAEKKQFMQAFIERIDIFPERREDGNWIQNIKFQFPVPIIKEGKEIAQIKGISLDKEKSDEHMISLEKLSTLETVVLLSKGAKGPVNL